MFCWVDLNPIIFTMAISEQISYKKKILILIIKCDEDEENSVELKVELNLWFPSINWIERLDLERK